MAYESGGITGGSNLKALLAQMQGGTAGPAQAPPMQAPAGPTLPGPPAENTGVFGQNPQPGEPMAPAAFDPRQQVGHDGSINGLNREQYRDKWQGSGAKSIGDLEKFISENGGTLQSGNGTALTPFGESMDLLEGARTNGNGKPSWGGGGGPAAPAMGQSMQPRPMGGMQGGLQGDPTSNIQQALAQYTQKSPNLAALLAQMGGQ